MAQYKKKPVVIEAVQYNGTRDWGEAPDWLIKATQKDPSQPGSLNVHERHATIYTLEGIHTANPGDYIIRGVNGELYPCKPDIFEKTYDPA
jgi:hypothetical protein